MNQVQFYLYLPGPQFIKNDNQIWNFDEYKEAIYWSLPPEQYNTTYFNDKFHSCVDWKELSFNWYKIYRYEFVCVVL